MERRVMLREGIELETEDREGRKRMRKLRKNNQLL